MANQPWSSHVSGFFALAVFPEMKICWYFQVQLSSKSTQRSICVIPLKAWCQTVIEDKHLCRNWFRHPIECSKSYLHIKWEWINPPCHYLAVCHYRAYYSNKNLMLLISDCSLFCRRENKEQIETIHRYETEVMNCKKKY